jgi:flagellar FliL protein
MSDAPPVEKPPKPAGSKLPKVMFIILLLNFGASGFTTFKVMTAPPAAAAEHSPPPPPNPTEVTGPVIPMDAFVVNLDEPGQSRYLKMTIQLELVDAEAEESLTKSKQLVRDAILSHLSGLHHADTLGAAAKDKLRTELMAKIEKIVGEHKVRRMFFQEFVVQ